MSGPTTVEQLQAMECDPGFEWLGALLDLGLQPLLGTYEPRDQQDGWVFDHVPKTGGSRFSALCDEQLHDAVRVERIARA